MRERVRGYAVALLEVAREEGCLERTADDLAAFVGVVEGSPDLRGVMSDPGVPRPTRLAVVTDLLTGRVLPATLRLVSYVTAVEPPPGFVEAIRWLAVRARAEVCQDDRGRPLDPLCGRSGCLERLDGYTTGVLEALPVGPETDEVEDELFQFARVVDGSAELRSTLSDVGVPGRVRAAIVTDLLRGGANPATVRLAAYAAGLARPRDYRTALNWLVERTASERGRRVATVTSAVPLDELQQARLAAALAAMVGRPVDIRVVIDRAVLAGFAVTLGDSASGDLVIDGTVRRKLQQLRRQLQAAVRLPERLAP